jgi:hypothetical protein
MLWCSSKCRLSGNSKNQVVSYTRVGVFIDNFRISHILLSIYLSGRNSVDFNRYFETTYYLIFETEGRQNASRILYLWSAYCLFLAFACLRPEGSYSSSDRC